MAIRFRFRFRPEVKRRGRARGLGRYGRRVFERAPSGFSSIEGRLLERGTGKPIGGALVVLPGLRGGRGTRRITGYLGDNQLIRVHNTPQ